MLRGKPRQRRRSRSAGYLSRHRQRSRSQRLDLCRPGDRVDARGLLHLGGVGRDQRPGRGPLQRRAPGPIIDMLDDIGRPENAQRLDRGRPRPRRPPDGLRPPGLPGPRPSRRRPESRRAQTDRRLQPSRTRSPGLRRGGRGGGAGHPEGSQARSVAADQCRILHRFCCSKPWRSPPSTFTCVFATGRVAGWIAHAREQLAGGRLDKAAVAVCGTPSRASPPGPCESLARWPETEPPIDSGA